ncbi:hypothetical protein [Fructilactobacillus sanfranciscensis]|uniref:hypothetical protein n=1 Tax=Fructilactobacillus sanfranciscensis TaxID=1625 RepID=UPI0013D6A120|nr:hypothetical protein [Fructilactobacillus sanfranciscensis]
MLEIICLAAPALNTVDDPEMLAFWLTPLLVALVELLLLVHCGTYIMINQV